MIGSSRSHLAVGGALLLGALDVAFINVRLVPAALVAAGRTAPGFEGRREALAPAADPASPRVPPAQSELLGVAAREAPADPVVPAREAPADPVVATTVVATTPASAGPKSNAPAGGPWVVYFHFDEAQIEPRAQAVLAAIAGKLSASPSAHVSIDGFADPLGPAPYNVDLSRRRAEATAAWLQKHGVARRRIEVRGRGEQGTTRGGSDSIAASGRRVELRINEAER